MGFVDLIRWTRRREIVGRSWGTCFIKVICFYLVLLLQVVTVFLFVAEIVDMIQVIYGMSILQF